MPDYRLFVAIRPPQEVRTHLLSMMGGIPGARWQTDEQLHVTLRFIGEVDRHRAEDVAIALGRVRHPSLDIMLGGAGCFGRRGMIDTLWIGIAPRDGLQALHDKIGRALSSIGLEQDKRAYAPHITIARFSRSAAPAAAVLAGFPHPAPIRFRAEDFRLYRSELGREGASYETIARYPLI